ncbi:hypothetical protein BKA70DRAFT_1229332 [Coprinopsis sp. MPI-PUGE-AT-0042]|nr:hypothetical protein BKA70DRAFT_1229332 [Coprinopsis sp. MPI-PUGE-AT-0042]
MPEMAMSGLFTYHVICLAPVKSHAPGCTAATTARLLLRESDEGLVLGACMIANAMSLLDRGYVCRCFAPSALPSACRGSRRSRTCAPFNPNSNVVTVPFASDCQICSRLVTLAKALEGKNIKELLFNVGSGGGASTSGGAGGAGDEAPNEEEMRRSPTTTW